ncbi:hypothetical protein Rsub_03748 [Raphidocelis subcapitata]|uniref:BTB domain-containing protein n=1 Tax=Raphidocelis subcapitata TaxID=307507 RepID=A0A2V0NZ85_9CHLO|nr:hypothetical protein Rsub_03748 [Raphidocelis subcapitata]|eukprot:GBF90893.1 hypothetical protein Rsub_03748 [Raphidocelis subcapitata]
MEALPAFLFKRDELQAGAASFFNQDAFSDIALVAPDGRRLKCHRIVLAACSPPLAATLPTCTRPCEELPVTGVDSGALEAVVRFFYEGRLLLTPHNAVAVMDAAARLQVATVAEAARAYVRGALSARTAMALLVEALRFEVDDLVDEALACIVLNFEDVSACPDFLAAPFPIAVRVLGAAKASGLRSGRALFAAAWRWVTCDVEHVPHLEEMLSSVLSHDLSVSDLLSVSGLAPGGAAGGAAAPVLQQLLAARGMGAGAGAAAAPEPVPAPSAAPVAAPAAPVPLQVVPVAGAPLAMPLPPALLTSLSPQLQMLSGLLQSGAAQGGAGPEQLAALLAAALPAATSLLSQAGAPAGDDVAALQLAAAQAGLSGGGADDSDPPYEIGADAARLRHHSRGGGTPPSTGLMAQRAHLTKGICQVDGCFCDLSTLRDYHQRYKICEYHLKVPSVMRDSIPQRFCQQCGRFHPLEAFDGTKRSCRSRLHKHNERRRKRDPAGTPPDEQRKRRAGSGSGSEDDDYGPPRRSYGARPASSGGRGGGGGGAAWGLDMLAAAVDEGAGGQPPGAEGAPADGGGAPSALQAMLRTLLGQKALPDGTNAAAYAPLPAGAAAIGSQHEAAEGAGADSREAPPAKQPGAAAPAAGGAGSSSDTKQAVARSPTTADSGDSNKAVA